MLIEDYKVLYLLLGEGWIIFDLFGLKLLEIYEIGKKKVVFKLN